MLPLATADTIVLSIVRVCNLIPLTEPEAPPQYVTTVVLSSTEVSWEEIPAIYHSGTITMYEVQYVPLNNLGEKPCNEHFNAVDCPNWSGGVCRI